MSEITFQGKPIHTCGELPSAGEMAPDFLLTSSRLVDVCLADFSGKKKLLNIVPSLDTPTCAISARKFNEKAHRLKNTVMLMISADLPFAQDRFCGKEKLKDIVPLSTFRSSFSDDYGVRIIDSILSGLTARAVVIIDENNKITYSQLVQEIAEEPDYESALEVLSKAEIS